VLDLTVVDMTMCDAAQHVPRHIIAEASLGSSVCAMVRAGMGIGLVNPPAARDEYLNGGIEMSLQART
jgi:DNA-binding transcriptional LysR family regulator